MSSHTRQIVTIHYPFYTEPDEEIEYMLEVRATVYLFTDPCYGMDADGNRGTERTEITDIDIESIDLHIPDRDKPFPLKFNKANDLEYFLSGEEIDRIYQEIAEQCQ